jgi:hypothetical protein
MRYFIVSYFTRPNGQMDEVTAVSRNLKTRDRQTAAVILDFKKLQVLQAHMNGTTVPKDWDRIVSYYHQHYPNIVERLFKENGYEIQKPSTETASRIVPTDTSSVSDQS